MIKWWISQRTAYPGLSATMCVCTYIYIYFFPCCLSSLYFLTSWCISFLQRFSQCKRVSIRPSGKLRFQPCLYFTSRRRLGTWWASIYKAGQFGFPYVVNGAIIIYFKMLWASWRGRKLGENVIFGYFAKCLYNEQWLTKHWGLSDLFYRWYLPKLFTFIHLFTHSTSFPACVYSSLSICFTGFYSFFLFQRRHLFI